MELTSQSTGSLRLNSKRGQLYINPVISDNAKIIILNDNAEDNIAHNHETLVIYGPGDFEASGILVKGTRKESDTFYTIDTDEARILYAVSTSISKLSVDDDIDVVVVRVTTPVEEGVLSSLSSKLVVVFGEKENVPEAVLANSVQKINLKKKEELSSNIVYLEKK
jgi:hypothetical protein